MKEWFIVCFTL